MTSGRGAAALALAVVGLAASGCGGGGGTADLAAGKATFIASCSSCHALADSGKTTANIGPNFDDSWRASRAAGIEDSQFEGTILRWIRIAQLPMPRDLVKGQDATNVAAYIASVAGKEGSESQVHPGTPAPEVPNPPRQDQQ